MKIKKYVSFCDGCGVHTASSDWNCCRDLELMTGKPVGLALEKIEIEIETPAYPATKQEFLAEEARLRAINFSDNTYEEVIKACKDLLFLALLYKEKFPQEDAPENEHTSGPGDTRT